MVKPNQYAENEDEYLRNNWLTLSTSKLSEFLGRSIASVRQRAKLIGLPKKKNLIPWTKEEDELLLELYKKKLDLKTICSQIGHSETSVRIRANRAGMFRSDPHLKIIPKTENFYLFLKQKIGRGSAGAKCCICSYSKHIDLHHIDGNRDNNHWTNISSLCPNCHREVEAGSHEDKKLSSIWWRIYSDGETSPTITHNEMKTWDENKIR